METKIIINHKLPEVPKGEVVCKHTKMKISHFDPDLFKLMELDEIEGNFIGHRGYMNLNALVLDRFLADQRNIPELFKGNYDIYFMDTRYNPSSRGIEDEAFNNVRCLSYNKNKEVFEEGRSHLYHQEFYSGFAALYNIKQHTENEMKNLHRNIGKEVRIFTTKLAKGALAEYMPDGYVASLETVIEYDKILTLKKKGTLEDHGIFPFIGPKDGIIKIVLESTGEILYENLDLEYPNNIGLMHINSERERKYGTNQYALEKIPLI